MIDFLIPTTLNISKKVIIIYSGQTELTGSKIVYVKKIV